MAHHGKRSDATVHVREPLNIEPSLASLGASPVTPIDAFYVRNHGPVPSVDAAAFRLRVEGLVESPLELGLHELRDGRFTERELTVTLQCAGSRRASLMAVRDIPGESPWGPGATGTARWHGVALADVLAAARPLGEALHVGFEGLDPSTEIESRELYGSSIPLRDVSPHDVLLAWSMNGEPLPAVHGGPLRVVVPGYIGARSVKWVRRIELRERPWDGHYQAVAYRLVPAELSPGRGVGMELGLIAVNSDVFVPPNGSEVEAGPLSVRGYAFAGGRRSVERVDVSLDGGASWRQAALGDDLGMWAWRLWSLAVELPPGDHEIVVRAWDTAAGTQPETAAGVWNPKGYVNNSWGRVRVRASSPRSSATT